MGKIYPVQLTIAEFANFCLSQEEHPYFLSDAGAIGYFFRGEKGRFPEMFEDFEFDMYQQSEKVDKEISNFQMSRIIWIKNNSRNLAYEVAWKSTEIMCKRMSNKEKEIFGEISGRFYHFLGCDEYGDNRLRSKLKR